MNNETKQMENSANHPVLESLNEAFISELAGKYAITDSSVLQEKLQHCAGHYFEIPGYDSVSTEKKRITALHDKLGEVEEVLASLGAAEKNHLEYHSRLGMNLADVLLMMNELRDAAAVSLDYLPNNKRPEIHFRYFVICLYKTFMTVHGEPEQYSWHEQDEVLQQSSLGFIQSILEHLEITDARLAKVNAILKEI